jgi:eukaryotic-like serine/threonine-protein kinase
MSDFNPRLEAALAHRYRIERELGEGGMATVYLAEDLKHERLVAVKVLKPELAAVLGGDRFLTEIKTTASLQHPHILPLFESGQADSFLFYVMPYIEGESLRGRIDREKQLSVTDALRIAVAVADALDYAHRHDIIHRDIKPENILLHEGNPVVADFGIALAVSAAGGGRMTETGLSLGTPHYMSPEQATAERELSARSDVYSLACVLYEMLTGDPPHVGPTPQSILMRILTEEPRSVTEVRKSVPPHVAAALTRGLEKLPADRFETAAEFRDALEDEGFTYRTKPSPGNTTSVTVPATDARPTRGFDWRLAGALGLAAVMTVAAITGRRAPEPPGRPPTRSTLDTGPARIIPIDRVVVSPDGRRFAYSGRQAGTFSLYQRSSDAERFRPIPGTDGAQFPTFSPDGEWIAYTNRDGGILKISVSGGAPRPVLPNGDYTPITLSWSKEGSILFSDGDKGVFRVSDTGGQAELLFAWGSTTLRPFMLPGGRGALATSADGETLLYDVRGDSVIQLLPAGVSATYLPTGHIMYSDSSGRLWVVDFDLDALAIGEDPTPVLDDLTLGLGAAAQFDVSETGTLVYGAGGAGANAGRARVLTIIDFAGGEQSIPIAARVYRSVRWSPDGSSIAFSALSPGDSEGTTSVYLYNVDLRTATRQLTFEGTQGWPVWSPDGQRIAFSGTRGVALLGGGRGTGGIAGSDVWVKSVYDDSDPEPLFDIPDSQFPYAWTSGNRILFTSGAATSSDLLYVEPDDSTTLTTYLDIDQDLGAVAVSPDGRHAAMASSESGEFEIVVRSFPEAGQPVQISEGGGDRPRWAPDGQGIYFWKGASIDTLMLARLHTEPVLSVVSTEVMLTGNFNVGTWDLHPDGNRIVIAREDSDDAPAGDPLGERTLVVVNWFEELMAILGKGR